MNSYKFNDYFLGASYQGGFFSLFEKAYDPHDGWTACIIKGGPGTGKSSLMKKIANKAAERGEKCERAFCSSDPESLDAVIMPDRKFIIMDGTAPHVVNANYPGICENLLDLGQCWDRRKLLPHKARIVELTEKCSECHRQAQRCLKAADAFRGANLARTDSLIDIGKVHRTAEHMRENLPKRGKGGCVSQRLLSAVTKDGVKVFENTIHNQCDVCIPIDDRWTRCSAILLGKLEALLLKDGFGLIVCRCSQAPDTIEHLIIPEARTAYSSANRVHSVDAGRTVHTSRFMKRAFSSDERKTLIDNEKNERNMLDCASQHMREAKTLHDELEKYYIDAMNFDMVGEIGKKLINEIFS